MSENSQSPEIRHKNIADFFDNAELKQLFKKFLILIGAVELIIFFLCWIYQLGLKEFDRFGNVNILFPWKTYFLLAFLVPVAITFLLGIFVVAFNNYVCGSKLHPPLSGSDDKPLSRLQTWWNVIFQLPFLFMLLLLGVTAGIVYKMEEIAAVVGRLGEEAFNFVLIIAAAALVVATLFGLIWMILTYKLKKKNMEYRYKSEVMERLGIVFLDDKVIINQEGKRIAVDKLQKEKTKRLPPATQ